MIKGKELLGRPVIAIDSGERLETARDLVFDHQANQVLGILILTWAIHTFLKGPGDVRPSWGSAFVVSIVMTVILIAFGYLLLQVMPRGGMA